MSAVPPESPRASADPSEHTTEHSGAESQAGNPGTDFGPNEWLVDELYQRYLADPGSVAYLFSRKGVVLLPKATECRCPYGLGVVIDSQ